MKTIKVKDLLIKIINKEEIPKKVSYFGSTYEYKKLGDTSYDYESRYDGLLFEDLIKTHYMDEMLEVELKIEEEIEEEKDDFTGMRFYQNGEVAWSFYTGEFPPLTKKIEKIEMSENYIVNNENAEVKYVTTNVKDRDIYIKKINELIDAVNELRKDKENEK